MNGRMNECHSLILGFFAEGCLFCLFISLLDDIYFNINDGYCHFSHFPFRIFHTYIFVFLRGWHEGFGAVYLHFVVFLRRCLEVEIDKIKLSECVCGCYLWLVAFKVLYNR